MPIVRCSSGEHHYDDAKHTSCPYCPQIVAGNLSRDLKDTLPLSNDPYADTGDDTRAYKPDLGGKTVAFRDSKGEDFNPPVGWFVVVSESNRGRVYTIRNGWNDIGRDATSDIFVDFDDGVSRHKHAFVIYDPESNEFFVKHGEGTSGTRLNDKMVGDLTPLRPFDKVRIGSTELVFAPLCGEGFKWGTPKETL